MQKDLMLGGCKPVLKIPHLLILSLIRGYKPHCVAKRHIDKLVDTGGLAHPNVYDVIFLRLRLPLKKAPSGKETISDVVLCQIQLWNLDTGLSLKPLKSVKGQ